MIVTSFHQEGYHQYGKKFIEGFLEKWPDEELTVYYEKGIPSSCPKDPRITYRDLYVYNDFKEFEKHLLASDPVFRGVVAHPQDTQKTLYNFRFDANRFFRKVYAITEAYDTAKAVGNDFPYLIWLDADILFDKDPLPVDFAQTILPEDYAIAHLNREWLYTEAGGMIFNMRHPIMELFMVLYRSTYLNGAFRYLGELHDCYVLDLIIRQLGMPTVNLTVQEKSDHPFEESIFGKYMTHLKGPERKKKGALLETDPQRKSA